MRLPPRPAGIAPRSDRRPDRALDLGQRRRPRCAGRDDSEFACVNESESEAVTEHQGPGRDRRGFSAGDGAVAAAWFAAGDSGAAAVRSACRGCARSRPVGRWPDGPRYRGRAAISIFFDGQRYMSAVEGYVAAAFTLLLGTRGARERLHRSGPSASSATARVAGGGARVRFSPGDRGGGAASGSRGPVPAQPLLQACLAAGKGTVRPGRAGVSCSHVRCALVSTSGDLPGCVVGALPGCALGCPARAPGGGHFKLPRRWRIVAGASLLIHGGWRSGACWPTWGGAAPSVRWPTYWCSEKSGRLSPRRRRRSWWRTCRTALSARWSINRSGTGLAVAPPRPSPSRRACDNAQRRAANSSGVRTRCWGPGERLRP